MKIIKLIQNETIKTFKEFMEKNDKKIYQDIDKKI